MYYLIKLWDGEQLELQVTSKWIARRANVNSSAAAAVIGVLKDLHITRGIVAEVDEEIYHEE
jgi:hypothetical protein